MVVLSPDMHKKLLLSVGSHRATRPLSPIEVAQAVQACVNGGDLLHEVSQALHLEDTSVLTKFVRLLQLAPEVRHLVDWGRSESTIGFTAASEVARLTDPGEQAQLCQACLEHQLGSAETKQVLQLRKRSKQPLDACVQEVLKLRPQIERLHVFLGGITSPETRDRLSRLTQGDRDELLRATLREQFPVAGAYGCRLGTDGFTITGSEKASAALSEGGKDIEAIINTALSKAVAS